MTMQINLTIVVQMIHFLFAYLILSKFFLRPGYDALKEDDERLHNLRSVLIQEQEILAQKKEYKRSRWQICQNYFYKHRPVFETEILGLQFIKPIESVSIDKHTVKTYAEEISTKLWQKVLQ